MDKGLETIYIRTQLKEFLENQKNPLKRRVGRFLAITERLTYYLADSEMFLKDFKKFVAFQEESDEDLLELLTKK